MAFISPDICAIGQQREAICSANKGVMDVLQDVLGGGGGGGGGGEMRVRNRV